MLFKNLKYNRVYFDTDDAVLSDPGVAPRTREDNFWALMADDPNAVEMDQKTKIEYYMTKIADRLEAVEAVTALIPIPKKADEGMVITVNSDGEYELSKS